MKGIWPSERVNSQVDWLKADTLRNVSSHIYRQILWTAPGIKANIIFRLSFSHCVMSHLCGFLPYSMFSLAFSVILAILSQAVSTLSLSVLFLFHASDFHSHLMSPYVCWPAEHIKAPLTPHCPGKIGGRQRDFISQSSTAMRQYETLITERSGLGNGLL